MIKFLVRLPRHRSFDYSPIYFDEAKEDLEKRVAKAKGEGNKGNPILRGSLKDSWTRNSARNHGMTRFSGFRVLGIAVVLAMILMWIIK